MDFRARWYDAKVGQFTSEDPLGLAAGDANLRRFVFNAPTMYTDPSGMFAVSYGTLLRSGGRALVGGFAGWIFGYLCSYNAAKAAGATEAAAEEAGQGGGRTGAVLGAAFGAFSVGPLARAVIGLGSGAVAIAYSETKTAMRRNQRRTQRR
jgi:hypothetical protein